VTLSVTVLGCDGSHPGPGGAASGYLVRAGATSLWLDAGSGTLANLQRHLDLAELSAVVLSHEHPDHRCDLEGFSVACAYGLERHGVPVFAPPGLRRHVYHDPPGVLSWTEVRDGDTVRVGEVELRFSRTDHEPETLAVRVEAGSAALGYSADSGPGWSLEALGPGLDLALCEATYLSDREGKAQHMSARQAGESGRAAGVRRLVLTHRWPGIPARAAFEEASTAFGRPVELAVTDATYGVLS
jgi:ribonuclease BN (tRNA processing enzyme)